QAFIPSIRQGKQTAEYIDHVLTRITLGGAIYVSAVCIIPSVISQWLRVPFQWGGTSIMIVVGVALDTVSQIEAHLITRNYEGLSGGGGRSTRIRGRRDVAWGSSSSDRPAPGKAPRPRSSATSGGSPRSHPATCFARRRSPAP